MNFSSAGLHDPPESSSQSLDARCNKATLQMEVVQAQVGDAGVARHEMGMMQPQVIRNDRGRGVIWEKLFRAQQGHKTIDGIVQAQSKLQLRTKQAACFKRIYLRFRTLS